MRTYRAWWTAAFGAITCAAVVAGAAVTPPWIFAAQVITVGCLAAAFGRMWEEDPRKRSRTARVWGVRGAVVAINLTGLPPLIGSWSLLVLVAMGATTPDVVLAVRRLARRRHDRPPGPAGGLSDSVLARRWKYTTIAVHSSWRTPAELLLVVHEREQLLDELERRDPDAFRDWLVSSGWRQPQHR